MLSATQLNFSTRQGGDLPAWVSGSTPRLRLWSVADAKTVTLRLGSENVLVLVRERSSLLVGEISSFERGGGDEVMGMRIGELIVFTKQHIFDASP